jgi:hypothetical protein
MMGKSAARDATRCSLTIEGVLHYKVLFHHDFNLAKEFDIFSFGILAEKVNNEVPVRRNTASMACPPLFDVEPLASILHCNVVSIHR